STLLSGYLQWQSGAKIQTDILAMLPTVNEQPLTQRAMNAVEQQLANRLYIGIIATEKAEAVNAALLLIKQLQSHSAAVFTDVASADLSRAKALSAFYFPYRFNLLTQQQQQLLTQDQWPQLVQNSLHKLYSAFGYANSALISQDPLLLYPDNLLALAPKQSLTVDKGILVKALPQDDKAAPAQFIAVVMAKGIQSAFSPNAQHAQLNALTQATDAVKSSYAAVSFIKAGALFHAAAATDNAKQEVSTIGVISLVGVVLLVWFAFRSIMPLTIAVMTLSCSLLFAVVFTLMVFGQLHLLTLVFGTSLIGIAIDYCFHFYCERLDNPRLDANRATLAILPAISLALITSIVAYGSLGLAPFPGMQQVAVFCGAGLIGAYVTLIFAYPKLANTQLKPQQHLLELADRYQQLMLTRLRPTSSHARIAVWSASLAFIIIGLTQLTSNDDIRQLQHTPVDIQQQEDRLRTVLSGGTDNQFLLVQAPTEEQLKQQLEQIEPILINAQKQQLIGNHFSLSPFLPSEKTQAHHYHLQQQIYLKHLPEILTQLGIDDSVAKPLVKEYLAAKGHYINAKAFFNSPASQQLNALWLNPEQGSHYGAIVMLGGIRHLQQLSALFSDNPNVQLVDRVAEISTLMSHYRKLTLALLLVALVAALGIFTVRFGIKLATIVIAVPSVAAITTLASLGLLQDPLTLFHALALILVFGIGIDYSLFFAEADHKTRGVMMAVLMS
ncbi:MMPL family transporter, partial [Shewanella sp.]|nr:MMPL family transporter [Shewanella sp.]